MLYYVVLCVFFTFMFAVIAVAVAAAVEEEIAHINIIIKLPVHLTSDSVMDK